VIIGEGLLLRSPTSQDRERWLELYRDPDELRWGLPVGVPIPDSLEALDERIAQDAEQWAQHEPGDLIVADEQRPDRLLGVVAWRRDHPPLLRIVDVGYVVHPDSRRQGVASRAVRVLTRWLTVDEHGPHQARVQLDHSVENDASCRTALAAGFFQEGVRRGFLPLRDPEMPDGVRRHDVCLHGYLPPS
jgi:RimJ/RimL family protein N-acetyltransferase